MKKQILFVCSLIFVISSVCLAQEATPAASPAPKPKPAMSRAQVQNKLISMEKMLWGAWKDKNVKAFQTNIWANAVMVGGGGVQNKAGMLKDLADTPCEVRSFSLSDFKVTWIDNDAAMLTYKGTQDGTCSGQTLPASVWASSLWVKRGSKWYAASHQETTAMP